MVGDLTVRPRVEAAPGQELPLAGRRDNVRAAVEGDATALRIAGTVVLAPLPDGVREAGLLALLTGLLLATWGAVQKGTAPFLFPLYARLASRDLLSNAHRHRLYAAVTERPFIHLRDLERTSGLGYGCVTYHMHVLKRERLVASVKTPGREHFFVPLAGLSREDMRRLTALADPTRCRIATHVAGQPGATQAELVAALDVGQGLLSRHLSRLAEAGLVRSDGARNKRYHPTPLLGAWLLRGPPARAELGAMSAA